jgi:putative chitinase
MLTESQLKQMIPGNKHVGYWHNALEQLLPDYDINTPQRIAAFIAQCAHESGNFTTLKENLNYRPATLRKLFPKYFPTDELAEEYCRKSNKQEAIANRIYANRMGNSSEFDTADPPSKWIGRGLIQLTGRHNYQNFADSIEVDGRPLNINEVPEYLATFEGAAQSACWFWETNKLNTWADAGNIKELTRRINGGFIGLEDRIKHYNHALSVMHGSHV